MEITFMEELQRYERQFLVHSFLYYKLDCSIIPDHEYDRRCNKMMELIKSSPEEARTSKYYELCEPCGTAGSGYYIQDYPPEIVTTGLQLLYRQIKPPEDFSQFIGRWGYSLEGKR